MRRVKLRFSDKYALIDDEDYELVAGLPWRLHSQGYATYSAGGGINRQYFLMHRMILNPALGEDIDHINFHRLDNRRSNLRICTRSENQMHKRYRMATNTSGYKGVSRHVNGLWRARIVINGKEYTTYHKTRAEASKAYKEMSRKLHGEFSNFK